MHSQRARAAGSRAERRLLNGPRRARSKAFAEYSATFGIRQLPGICRYPAESVRRLPQIKVAPRV
ncbi:MAG: hypothetical protein DBY25_04960 [Clostridiales bacterium]|nr:MAG: hypothetical protein DBY25_04960 [Clostridiales bacterium]